MVENNSREEGPFVPQYRLYVAFMNALEKELKKLSKDPDQKEVVDALEKRKSGGLGT